MSGLARLIEELLLPAVAIIGLVVSLADLFDVLRFVGDHLPMLTFLVLSLVIASLSSVQSKCMQMRKDIRHLLSEAELERLERVVGHVDPNLRKVFDDDYFLDVLNFFQIAVREKCVHVNDRARFCHYYIRTLQLFPKATLLSVSTSITSDLWKDIAIIDAMAQFIKGKGKIKQVICLKDAKEEALPEVQTVLARLQAIGVQVSFAFNGSMPNEKKKKNFMVESKGKIGWEMEFDSEGSVTTSIVTTNQEKTASYRKMFEKLRVADPQKFGSV